MKTALIIDGNYLLSKDVFILTHLRTLHLDLENLLRKDIEKILKLYPFDKYYFVSDSKYNWRKKMFPTYKGDRKKDEKIDWEWVYKIYNELKVELSNNKKITQLEVDSAEGDDIIAFLINQGNLKGYSNLIIASDSDIQQLLRFDIHKEYINLMYNYKFSDERLYLPQNYNVFLNNKSKGTASLFDMDDDDEFISFINKLKHKTKVVEIDTEELLFCKLISGDKKDSIPSIYKKMGKTGKLSGIGRDGAKTLYKLYKELDNSKIDFNSDTFVDKVCDVIEYNKKIKDENILKEIKENLKLNRKLTILTNNYLPSDLLTEMKNVIKI